MGEPREALEFFSFVVMVLAAWKVADIIVSVYKWVGAF